MYNFFTGDFYFAFANAELLLSSHESSHSAGVSKAAMSDRFVKPGKIEIIVHVFITI